MTTSPARSGAALAVTSMTCVQLGLAVSVSFIDRIGAPGTAALRLGWAGLIFLVIARPRRRDHTARSFLTCVALGVVTAALTICFLGALERLPLATAVAIEFLGPLGVAMARGARGTLRWPLLAGTGVLLLVQPWHGSADPVGLLLAFTAAAAWAGYILLTQKVGDELTGIKGLGISMPVAGLTALLVAGPGLTEHLTWQLLLAGAGLAVLLPAVPFTLEMLALRRLTTAAFGTLMALEPAIALVVGVLLLTQLPDPLQVGGLALVVAAGIGASRAGARTMPPSPPAAPAPPAAAAGERRDATV